MHLNEYSLIKEHEDPYYDLRIFLNLADAVQSFRDLAWKHARPNRDPQMAKNVSQVKGSRV